MYIKYLLEILAYNSSMLITTILLLDSKDYLCTCLLWLVSNNGTSWTTPSYIQAIEYGLFLPIVLSNKRYQSDPARFHCTFLEVNHHSRSEIWAFFLESFFSQHSVSNQPSCHQYQTYQVLNVWYVPNNPQR